MRRMGIRYYAYPVDADDIDDARANPYDYLGVDPLVDAWGPEAERPEMLYLDKCWSLLQTLLATPPARPSRPAAALVRGDVIQTPDGWIPHVEVLPPAGVAEAARDLATVTPERLRAAIRHLPARANDADEFCYVSQYLDAAREFTTRLAKDGRGLIYLIG